MDIKDIATSHFFDFLVVPSVLAGRDIQEIKLALGADASNIQVIAKIDSLDAVQNFTGIIK